MTDPNEKREFLPPLEFSSLIMPFYMPALIKLGLIEDPASGEPQPNLDHARRLIDLLDLLRDRTKGNLEPEEQKLLEAALIQLKEAYLGQTGASKA
jgi:hypothetical protein